jgi:multiple sugar transport system permease protein
VLVELATPEATRPEVHTTATLPRWRRLLSGSEAYLYIVPALIGIAVWIYRPLLQTLDYSFYNWNLLPSTPKLNVGWHNYSSLLHMPQLWQAVGTSGLFMAGLITFGMLLPLLIGVVTENVSPKSRTTYRALIFLPVLVSPVVTATVWQFLLSPSGGVIDTILAHLGLAQTNWLQQPNTAKYAVVAISGWKVLGVSVLIVTAGLAAISTEYYEAAAIDGANRSQIFRSITLPLLSPTLLFMFITAVLLSSQIIFPLLNVLTQGGPSGSTTDIYYFMFEYGFTSFDVGLASAAAVCFFIVFGTIAIVCVRLLERFSFYDN